MGGVGDPAAPGSGRTSSGNDGTAGGRPRSGWARSRASRRAMPKFRCECRWACADPFVEKVGRHTPQHWPGPSREENQGPCIPAGLREIDSYQRSASVFTGGWERVIECIPHGSRLQFGALNHGRRTAINRGSVCPQLPVNRTLHENHKATRMTRSGLRLVHSAPSSQVIGRATMLVATIDHAVPIVRNVRTTAATDESVPPYSGAKRLRPLSLCGARRDGRSWSHPSDQISLVLAVPECHHSWGVLPTLRTAAR